MIEPVTAAEAGHLFMVGVPGLEVDASTLALIREQGIHNFIIFKRNVLNRGQLRALCQGLAGHCRENRLPPPFIAIDQEGGEVARLPPPFTQFGAARDLAEAEDAEGQLRAYARICAQELLEAGINMNLAPVLDVCAPGPGYFMARRSLGSDPARVAVLGRLVIAAMQEAGLAACGKHFPGLGAAVLDPHLQLPTVLSSEARLREVDLLPFQAAIAAGVAAIMTSHTIYPAFDPETPATMSPLILTGLLRQELGFAGLVITDDLEMGAIEQSGPVAAAARASFAAGADLLLICHSHEKVRAAHGQVREALLSGQIPPARLRESVQRQVLARERMGLGG